VCARARV